MNALRQGGLLLLLPCGIKNSFAVTLALIAYCLRLPLVIGLMQTIIGLLAVLISRIIS